eukprot:c28336_g3_i1 orf=153-1802(+)
MVAWHVRKGALYPCSLPPLLLCFAAAFLTVLVGVFAPLRSDFRHSIFRQIWGDDDGGAGRGKGTAFNYWIGRDWTGGLWERNDSQLHVRSGEPTSKFGVPGAATSTGGYVIGGKRNNSGESSKGSSHGAKDGSQFDLNALDTAQTKGRRNGYAHASNPIGKGSKELHDDTTKSDSKHYIRNVTDDGIATKRHRIANHCDLFKGEWIPDPAGPLYRNDSCPILSQSQNCQGNGRPDKGYENWRWHPRDCDLSRFDAAAFFRVMSGKTLAFVGDSVARNQMESLMCILWQVETPKNIGNKKMQRWFFRTHSVTIIRIWSAWLVHTSTAAFQFAPENLTKLYLEEPDESFMNYLPKFDVLVLSSGHWSTKQTAYIWKDKLVGGQLWWDKKYPLKMKNVDAFAITIHTGLKAIVSHSEYKGLTILRTYSPDHYEGGAWNAGGSCTGKTQPLKDSDVAFNSYTELMRKHQLQAYEEAKHNISNSSKLRLMDITPVFNSRADGHPGPYRNTDPHKVTKRGPKGQPPPQDCLHWCMPGPIDTWNEFLLEIIKQEQE